MRAGDRFETGCACHPPARSRIRRGSHLVCWESLQKIAAAPQDAGVRAEKLVGRAGQEVRPQCDDIHRAVRNRMDRVHKYQCPHRAGRRRPPRGLGSPCPTAFDASPTATSLVRSFRSTGKEIEAKGTIGRIDVEEPHGRPGVGGRQEPTARRSRRGRVGSPRPRHRAATSGPAPGSGRTSGSSCSVRTRFRRGPQHR